MKTRYVVLLRGINVGGNTKVSMADLKKALERMGFHNVQTLLNSGNVVFDAEKKDHKLLTKTIEMQLEKIFSFSILVIVRSMEDIQSLIKKDPFKDIRVTPLTRLYVTFFSEKPASPTLHIPYTSPEKDFSILSVSDTEAISVLHLSETKKTPEAMSVLEKEYGKHVTTRNWNTILKIASLAA